MPRIDLTVGPLLSLFFSYETYLKVRISKTQEGVCVVYMCLCVLCVGVMVTNIDAPIGI